MVWVLGEWSSKVWCEMWDAKRSWSPIGASAIGSANARGFATGEDDPQVVEMVNNLVKDQTDLLELELDDE